ncbi:urease subunit beta, partial [bacterium]|nr:urease subunit beta [bacterium]
MAVTNTGDRPIQVGSHYRELSPFFLSSSSSSSSSQLSLSLSVRERERLDVLFVFVRPFPVHPHLFFVHTHYFLTQLLLQLQNKTFSLVNSSDVFSRGGWWWGGRGGYMQTIIVELGDTHTHTTKRLPPHTHCGTAFLETNPALVFDRKLSLGRRLNVPSGASVRFEPGESKTVTLVSLGGDNNVVCGNGLTGGKADLSRWDEIEGRMNARE